MEHTLLLEQITPAELDADTLKVLGAFGDDGQILRFKNAVLARSEVNKNRDDLTDPEFLQGVAETLPLQPIDVEHDLQAICGIFTAARMLDDGALATDGLIYMARYPEIAAGIQAGTHKLSIEATAPQVQCSLCGQYFSAGMPMCAHLLAKNVSGATRKLLGRGKAVGGAATVNPAGTRTEFDRSSVGIIASLDGEPFDYAQGPVLTFLNETEYTLYRSGVLAIAKVLTTQERNNLPDEDFALVQNGERRFPIGDCAHARNALSRLPQAKHLSDSERATIERKSKEKLATCGADENAASIERAVRLRAAAERVTDSIYKDLIQINQPSHIQLAAPVLAPHYYIPPFVMPKEEAHAKTPAAQVQAALEAQLTEQAKTHADVLAERERVIAELQGKIVDLEAKLAARKSGTIGLTALAVGKHETPSDTFIKVVPK